MELTEKKFADISILEFSGRLDAYSATEVEKKIDSLVDTGQVKLVINLTRLEYISSSGLRVFLAELKKVRKQQGDLKLAGLKPYIKEIFDIAGFTQLFNIFDDEYHAIESFTNK